MISIIAAVGSNGAIGKNNRLPWHLPADLTYFKEVTMGHAVVMGRKTFESIGKPLPGRHNIVLTRDRSYRLENCTVMYSIEEVLKYCSGMEVFVIGGAEVYRSFISHTDRLYLTFIDRDFEGDVFFPKVDEENWAIVSKTERKRDDLNPYDLCFSVYERK